MLARRRPLSRDTIIAIRDDYAAGELPTRVICARYGISSHALFYWVDGGDREGDLHFPPLPRRQGKMPRARQRRFRGEPQAVVRRLWRTAEAQTYEIERRLLTERQQPEERMQDARTLAILARALRDLAAIERGPGRETAASDSEKTTEHDEPAPRDIDELRLAVSRKLEALASGGASGVRGEP